MVLIFFTAVSGSVSGNHCLFCPFLKVPGRYYLFCGQIGAMGWSIYWSAVNMFHVSPYIGTFAAAVFVVMSSRIFCIKLKLSGNCFSFIWNISACSGSRNLLVYLLLHIRGYG